MELMLCPNGTGQYSIAPWHMDIPYKESTRKRHVPLSQILHLLSFGVNLLLYSELAARATSAEFKSSISTLSNHPQRPAPTLQ